MSILRALWRREGRVDRLAVRGLDAIVWRGCHGWMWSVDAYAKSCSVAGREPTLEGAKAAVEEVARELS